MSDKLEREKHIRYFQHHLKILPHHYTSLDTNRMTLLFFCVVGLDILGALDTIDNKQEIIDWIYAQQVKPASPDDPHAAHAGFRGGSYLGMKYDPSGTGYPIFKHDHGHITMTYTALAILKTLGDDFSRVDKKSIIAAMKHLQREDGSFRATALESEDDMRFVYCAFAVAEFLQDYSGIDVERAYNFIVKSQVRTMAKSTHPH
eukprot:GEZU01025761.1.p1 GENE.GEZU01025761.1~~GEZU01025761.1.p1  ORF type:complete len:203 (-),score=31.22 GEZU01025761.1:475-1083(-)